MDTRRQFTTARGIAGQRWTESQARQVLQEWERSGEPMAAYARRRGLQTQRLSWWRKRLGRGSAERAVAAVAPAAFVPVALRVATVSEPTAPAAAVAAWVDVGGALRVELRVLDDASVAWLAALVRALEGGA
jgi:hypothetical protein